MNRNKLAVVALVALTFILDACSLHREKYGLNLNDCAKLMNEYKFSPQEVRIVKSFGCENIDEAVTYLPAIKESIEEAQKNYNQQEEESQCIEKIKNDQLQKIDDMSKRLSEAILDMQIQYHPELCLEAVKAYSYNIDHAFDYYIKTLNSGKWVYRRQNAMSIIQLDKNEEVSNEIINKNDGQYKIDNCELYRFDKKTSTWDVYRNIQLTVNYNGNKQYTLIAKETKENKQLLRIYKSQIQKLNQSNKFTNCVNFQASINSIYSGNQNIDRYIYRIKFDNAQNKLRFLEYTS